MDTIRKTSNCSYMLQGKVALKMFEDTDPKIRP